MAARHHSGRTVAHVAIGCGGIGPVRLDGNDCETVGLDQALRDRRAGAIKFGCAVAGLAQQDDAAIGEAVKELSESGIIEPGQRISRFCNHVRKRSSTRLTRHVVVAARRPSSDQPCSPIKGTNATAPIFSSSNSDSLLRVSLIRV